MLLYRILLSLLAPVFAVRLLRDPPADRNERLMIAQQAGPVSAGGVIWLHGASNGELTSAKALIDALLSRDPGLHIIVTSNSTTGRTLVQAWGQKRVEARLAPVDFRGALRRFIATWQPDALILIESELWPNRIAEMRRLERPVLALSARMSKKSARMWARFPRLAQKTVGAIEFLSAQDSASEQRFVDLGTPRGVVGPVLNLKENQTEPTLEEKTEIGQLRHHFTRKNTLLAASTHEGEESIILLGFHEALKDRPDLRLILAPRHPRRRAEIETHLTRLRLRYAVRSKDQNMDVDTPVYLADTLGEMPLWYRLAGITFVGGSLVDKGGHTPFEPVAHRSVVLHGPHVENFADVYAGLTHAQASRRVDGATDIAHYLLTLEAEDQKRLSQRALKAMADMRTEGALESVLGRIADLTGNAQLHP